MKQITETLVLLNLSNFVHLIRVYFHRTIYFICEIQYFLFFVASKTHSNVFLNTTPVLSFD